jgi:uncharacterized membrane protein
MNLDLSPLGWTHFLASLAAIAAGAAILVRPKGTALHKARGWIYVAVMALTNLTALGIYSRGVFFFAHWLAIAGLIITAAGVAAAHFRIPRKGWMHLHLTCMVASFYLLIGGAVNEAFLRVSFLRRLVPDLNSSFAVGMIHISVMILFAALIVYFNGAAMSGARAARRAALSGETARRINP